MQRCWPKTGNGDGDAATDVALTATFPPRAKPRAMSHLEFLLTCRQIYEGAWGWYYSVNDFDFGSMRRFVECCRTLSVKCRNRIRSVGTRQQYGEEGLVEQVVRVLRECEGLRRLRNGLFKEDVGRLREVKRIVDVKIEVLSWLESEEKERVQREVREVEEVMRGD